MGILRQMPGEMATPDEAYNFTDEQASSESMKEIATDTTRDVYNAIVSTPYNLAIKLPGLAVARGTRAAINTVFGTPWAVGHMGVKKFEQLISGGSPDGLRWQENGSSASLAA